MTKVLLSRRIKINILVKPGNWEVIFLNFNSPIYKSVTSFLHKMADSKSTLLSAIFLQERV